MIVALVRQARITLLADGDEIDWMFDGPWSALLLLFLAAAAVLTLSHRFSRARRQSGDGHKRPDFDLDTARLESLPVSSIAQAQPGPVHFEGVLASSTQTFGRGRPCVWLNRAGQSRATAIGAELVMLQDDSGQVGIENLESARVIAPKEPGVGGHDAVALYLGDRVQVLGRFRREGYGNADESDSERVYGLVGGDSPVQVRVLTRPVSSAKTADDPTTPGDDHEPS